MEFICSASSPWREGLPTPVVHPGAEEIKRRRVDNPEAYIVQYRCACCRHQWEMEIPTPVPTVPEVVAVVGEAGS